MANIRCEKCNKLMDEANFYTHKDGSKCTLCKKCMTMHIDNFDPSTFTWLLEEMDVPYVPEEWNILRDRAYTKDPTKMNGMSVFGKYISKMKLRQWKDYSWADSEKLQEERRIRTIEEQAMKADETAELRRQLENGKITEAQFKTLVDVESLHAEDPLYGIQAPISEDDNPYQENNFISEDSLPDLTAELTDEDKIYLVMKWGRLYKLDELIKLEQRYKEMTNAFEVNDPDTDETLKLLCKTSLKMNTAIKEENRSQGKNLVNLIRGVREAAPALTVKPKSFDMVIPC